MPEDVSPTAGAAPPALASTPALVFFAVQSALRLAGAVKDLSRERLLAMPVRLPTPPGATVSLDMLARAELSSLEGQALFSAEGAPLFGVFALDESGFAVPMPGADDADIRRGIKLGYGLLEAKHPDLIAVNPEGVFAPGVAALQDWAKGGAARSAWGRIGLVMADICLQFVGANARSMGLQGRAEVLVGALSRNLESLIPDDGNPSDPRVAFRERAVAAFLRAGLHAAEECVGDLAPEPHVAALAKGLLGPLTQAVDAAAAEGGARLPGLEDLRETLLGPMAREAVVALAKHQAAFLGPKFETSTAIGAVTESILGAACAGDAGAFRITKAFRREGLSLVYSAALSAAAKRPELFVRGEGAGVGAGRDLLARMADALAAAPPPFNDGFGAELAAMALDVAATHLPARFDATQPWDAAAATGVRAILGGFKQGLKARSLGAVFSRDQALGLVRIVMEQAARTPNMLTGAKAGPELQAIAGAIAHVLSDPATDLLSGEDWRLVAACAVAEAAKNPAALFAIEKVDTPAEQVGAKLLGDMLRLASANLAAKEGRKLGVVLFGETLREAMTATLRAASNNAAALRSPEGISAAVGLADTLNRLAFESDGAIGDREWLWLYRRFVADVIAKGQPPAWSLGDLQALLAEAGR